MLRYHSFLLSTTNLSGGIERNLDRLWHRNAESLQEASSEDIAVREVISPIKQSDNLVDVQVEKRHGFLAEGRWFHDALTRHKTTFDDPSIASWLGDLDCVVIQVVNQLDSPDLVRNLRLSQSVLKVAEKSQHFLLVDKPSWDHGAPGCTWMK